MTWLAALICQLALLFAQASAQRYGYGPPPPPLAPESSGCALIIPGVGRSSAYDYASRAFGAVGGYEDQGDDYCITYDAVNAAFTQARDRFGLSPVKGEFDAEEVGNLGTLINEASRILAQQYRLPKDAVANGLPLIDTTKTVIENYCPSFLMAPKCSIERYRSLSGMCNNIKNPHYGIAMTSHQRFLPPDFADGISAPRVASSGRPLPSPRLISSSVHKDEGFHDHAVTIMLVAWGQFIDHDITLTAETKDPKTGKTPKCCDKSTHANCLPIEIPESDSFFRKHNQKCMNFVRSEAGLRFNCKLGPRSSFNEISSFLDAGTVYGNSEELQEKLRTFKGGQLKALPVFDDFRLKPLLPLKLDDPNAGCIRPSEDVYCFLAGDPRVNEQTILATIHLLFLRQHNLICEGLAKINPHWSDETLFQETKHIIEATIQHITYNEFLPMVLGKEVMERHGLILQKNGYLDGYDPSANPASSTSFATAAFRFGHTLLPSAVERWSKSHKYVGSQRLSEMLQQPYDLYKGGWVDNYIMGMINQVAQAYDNSMSQEVTNHLFQEPGKEFGLDLASLNIQRGREHGLPSYPRWREWCGFPPIRSWEDLTGIFNNQTIYGYRKYYESFEDIDLWSAGVAEKPLPGSMMGPTFACILGKQFHNLKFGDRFWYEFGGWPSSFTLEQLAEIRKIKLSRIICDNSDEIDNIQVHVMVLPDHDINPRVPCKSAVLPRIDLSNWRDASYHGSPKSYRPF